MATGLNQSDLEKKIQGIEPKPMSSPSDLDASFDYVEEMAKGTQRTRTTSDFEPVTPEDSFDLVEQIFSICSILTK